MVTGYDLRPIGFQGQCNCRGMLILAPLQLCANRTKTGGVAYESFPAAQSAVRSSCGQHTSAS